MDLLVLITIILLHWVSDFVFQTNEMAQNKSKSNFWLAYHSGVYTIPFLVVFGLFFGIKGIVFALTNGVLHFITDWFTSRINSRLWEQKDVHGFFVGIGADQALHMAAFVGTYYWILQG